MNLGKAIKEMRARRGIKQGVLAERCGLDQSYLSLIESNKKKPTLSTLSRIAKGLNMPAPALMALAIDEADVADDKLDMFRKIWPPMSAFIVEFFVETEEWKEVQDAAQ